MNILLGEQVRQGNSEERGSSTVVVIVPRNFFSFIFPQPMYNPFMPNTCWKTKKMDTSITVPWVGETALHLFLLQMQLEEVMHSSIRETVELLDPRLRPCSLSFVLDPCTPNRCARKQRRHKIRKDSFLEVTLVQSWPVPERAPLP